MNYEKAYKEALAKCKAYIDDTQKRWSEEFCKATEEVFFEIFPELKEPEGEKIRKGLIALLKFGLEDGSAIAPGFNETKEQAINWLEKQGEQNYKIIKGKNYFCVKTHNYAGVEWIKGVKYYASDNYTLVNQGCEYYCPKYSKEEHNNLFEEDEQKQKWTDEDEELLQHCCGAVAAADYYTLEDKEEMENWLKSLKQRML